MTTARTVKVGLVQIRCDGSAADNLERALRGVAEAARAGAGIVALPELFLGPYFKATMPAPARAARHRRLAGAVPGTVLLSAQRRCLRLRPRRAHPRADDRTSRHRG